uniref:CSON004282 protein n=1 Tax=Culicoides sonorensis TaxID=179676 RepID=A0A336LES8_CULSO
MSKIVIIKKKDAIMSGEMVRLTPSLTSQKVLFGHRLKRSLNEADGIAFWYTMEQGDYNRNTFWSSDG